MPCTSSNHHSSAWGQGRATIRRIARRLVTTAAVQVLAILPCAAQVPLPASYSQYYQTGLPSYSSTSVPNSSRYLYDRYFYHRETVSPYLNLGRPGTDIATSYQAFVRPEQERRAAAAASTRAYVQQRKLEGNVGQTRAYMNPSMPTTTTPSAYYNHWYGGWAK